MRHLLFIFLDGVGLGPPQEDNPLARSWPSLEALSDGSAWTADASAVLSPNHVFHPIDATLNVDGLPQSGTGQATLFTGVNCAEVVGRHFGPFPHSKTQPILAQENIFRKVHALSSNSQSAAFANAYPPRFFEVVKRRDRWTVTTRCCLEADVPIRGIDELSNEQALTADLTGSGWHRIGHSIPTISEREAGVRLARIAHQHAFTLYEYFLTDKAGHGRLDAPPSSIVQSIDRFLSGVLDHLDPDRDLLVITSDHGNLERTSSKTHTRNPVPLVAYGRGAHHFQSVESIAEVTPAIAAALTAGDG